MNAITENAYDLVPYHSNAFAQSQPEQLAAIAKMFGLVPKLPSAARVLELGCSAGGNIIPLAARYPGAHFVGVDYSKVEADQAEKTINALGLKNIEVRCASIADLEKAVAPFDYIICHGVYSWVTGEIQDAILRICQENLAEDGIAYISYNTYPGWKMREVVRDAMLFHTKNLTDPKQKLEQARAIVKFTEEITDDRTAFGKMLKEEASIIGNAQDFYLYHDHLEANNHPCYFREFIERAHTHQLGYLGEANLGDMVPQKLGPKVLAALKVVAKQSFAITAAETRRRFCP